MRISIPALLSSTASGVFIFTILSFFIVWLCFPAENPSNSFKDSLNFSGSIFAGATTFGAAIVAGYLFNDWKEQHNKGIEIQFISRVRESHELFDLKITKMFKYDYSTIDIALRYDSFIRECLILDLDVCIIQTRYDDYYNFLRKDMPESHKEIFLKLRRSIHELKKTDDIRQKRILIKHRIFHDIVEFDKEYSATIHPNLLQNLKALN